jgi:hypothetical protein
MKGLPKPQELMVLHAIRASTSPGTTRPLYQPVCDALGRRRCWYWGICTTASSMRHRWTACALRRARAIPYGTTSELNGHSRVLFSEDAGCERSVIAAGAEFYAKIRLVGERFLSLLGRMAV